MNFWGIWVLEGGISYIVTAPWMLPHFGYLHRCFPQCLAYVTGTSNERLLEIHSIVSNSRWNKRYLSPVISQNKITDIYHTHCASDTEREREIKFIGLFENRGHRGPYSPYKPFNHNLYIGIIIFPHIDNPQYTGYDLPKKKPNKIINEKKWGPH